MRSPGTDQDSDALATEATVRDGYLAAIAARQRINDQPGAEELLRSAMARFPHDFDLAHRFALAAKTSANWAALHDRAATLRRHFAHQPSGYALSIAALRNLRRFDDEQSLLKDALSRFPDDAEIAAEVPLSAAGRGRWGEAARLWAAFRKRFAKLPLGYVFGIAALMRSNQLDAAAKLSEAGASRFPANPAIAVARAQVMERRSGPAAAEPLWGKAAALAPGHPEVKAARERRAGSPQARAAAERAEALAAAARQDWAGLERLSAILREATPNDPAGFHLGSRALRERRQPQNALALLNLAPASLEHDPAMIHERAYCALALRDWRAARDHWAALREVEPDSVAAYTMGAHALRQLGDIAAAEALIDRGRGIFPGNGHILIHWALNAMRRGDLAAARPRWDAARALLPDHIEVRNSAGAMRLIEQLNSLAEPDPADHENAESAAGKLLIQFESLGGNCEFGLIQRIAGVEPLGLLRFASNSADQLIGMLEHRLDGVGSEEQTELALQWHQEYFLSDRRYFSIHTFMTPTHGDQDALYPKMRRRMEYLRDKLLADLAAAEKIFVFRPASGRLADSDIERLHRAVRNFADNTLLCVRDAPFGTPHGAVEQWAPGLLVATIPGHEHFAPLNLNRAQLRYEPWLALCRAAWPLRAVVAA